VFLNVARDQVELAKPGLRPHFAWSPADGVSKHWPLKRKGMELSILSTRVDLRRVYFVEKDLVDHATQP
jgi:hypothetical protein